jgi:hypothetical protein
VSKMPRGWDPSRSLVFQGVGAGRQCNEQPDAISGLIRLVLRSLYDGRCCSHRDGSISTRTVHSGMPVGRETKARRSPLPDRNPTTLPKHSTSQAQPA